MPRNRKAPVAIDTARTASDEATSIHQRIRSDIEDRIMGGAWKPGHRLPVEHELMADYQCSRMTVSKALTALVNSGLIERRRRAGSYVTQPRVHQAVLEIPDIKAEILRRGESYAIELMSKTQRRPEAGDREIGFGANEPLLVLRCLHRANGGPFALEDRIISLAAVPDAVGVDFSQTPPGTWLLQHVPWTEAQHRITAIAARDAAGSLALGAEAPCLSLERWTWQSGKMITYVHLVFPGTQIDLLARFHSGISR